MLPDTLPIVLRGPVALVTLIVILHVTVIFYYYRGSYMSANVLLNVLKSWGKAVKGESSQAFYRFFARSLINSNIQEHNC